VYFEVVHPWRAASGGQTTQPGRQLSRYAAVRAALWLLALGVAACLAWQHARQGHADWQGTWRVMTWVVGLAVLAWLCGSRHSLDLGEEVLAAFDWFTVIVFCGAIGGLTYLAVEPFARRWWPWSILTFRRLLDGRLTDLAIWADVLLGLAVGLGAVAIRQLCTLANHALGIAVSALNDFDPSQNLLDHFGVRYRFAVLVDALLLAVLQSLLVLTLVVILKRVVKSAVLAAVIVVITLAALAIVGRGLLSPIDWLARTLLLSIMAWLLLRYGLVAAIVGVATYYAVNNSPLTLDPSTWFAPAGLFIVLITAAALVMSWRLARVGSPAKAPAP
jgi:hypothetical protein